MSGDLIAERYSKHQNPKKKFLEEACTMIELSNLMESLKLGHKFHEPSIYGNKVDSFKGKQRSHTGKSHGANDESSVISRPKSKSRLRATHRTGPPPNNLRGTKPIRKTIRPKPCTIDLKEVSKHKPQYLQTEVHQTGQVKKCSHKRQSLSPSSKKHTNLSIAVKERVVKRQLLESNLDKARCRQPCIKRNEKLRKTSIVVFPKTDFSKCSVKTWKSFPSFSDTCLFNKDSMKQISENRDTVYGVNKKDPKKSCDKKPSLQIKLNLQLEPISNTMNLQVKSKAKGNSDALNFRLPLQYSFAHQEKTSKRSLSTLSANFSTVRSIPTPSAQTSNGREINNLEPYAKMQSVYYVNDVTTYGQPGKVKGIRSHISFSMNIGRQPQAAQGRLYADEVRSLPPLSPRQAGNRKVLYNSKVNMNSGETSMQQSLSLGRSSPETESQSPYESQVCSHVCTCSPSASGYGTSDTQSIVCDKCRQANALQRTRQRIADRVGPSDDQTTIFSPSSFLKKIYNKIRCINNTVEEQTKSVGSCTCSPFRETEQFTVQEGDVNPECSLFKRVFGALIFNDKCVVCTENKKIGTGTKYRKLKPYECEPGTCEEKKPKKSPFACFKKICKKKKEPQEDKKKAKMLAKEKAKKEKAKKQEKLKKAKTKALKKKEKEKRDREKLKAKESGTSFISSIFMSPEEDDDRQKLLNDEGKKRRRDGDNKAKDKKGKNEGGTEPDNKATEKAKKTFAVTRRGYRRVTRRIRERYYRNKKLAEEQKGQYACDFYLMSLRNKPCLWVYYLCPVCYPYVLQALNLWRQVSDLLLFFVAIVVWSPCILCAECLKVVACNMCVS